MPRSDGRIEPGQRLTSAISARAWNRAQEAADLVLGERAAVQGGPVNVFTLQCVKVRLAHKGYFGECRVPAVSGTVGDYAEPAMPGSAESLSGMSENEKKLFAFWNVPTVPTSVSQGSSPHSVIFVCVRNNDNVYAMRGFAITRVRVWSNDHLYARVPVDAGNLSEVVGALDSAFWGPARIVGYFSTTGVLQKTNQSNESIPLGEYRYRWAVVAL